MMERFASQVEVKRYDLSIAPVEIYIFDTVILVQAIESLFYTTSFFTNEKRRDMMTAENRAMPGKEKT